MSFVKARTSESGKSINSCVSGFPPCLGRPLFNSNLPATSSREDWGFPPVCPRERTSSSHVGVATPSRVLSCQTSSALARRSARAFALPGARALSRHVAQAFGLRGAWAFALQGARAFVSGLSGVFSGCDDFGHESAPHRRKE